MPNATKFIMIGGFLGAGKTTLISKLARQFQADGKHVCVVTNDQAAGLVDTELLRSEGLDVNEVGGSCFCCNFNGLTDAMAEFETRQRPDVVLAEPVGSCTDLVATIALPMMQRLGTQFDHSPYAVVLKPSHALRILSGGQAGFSPKAEYIFRKQLEESELVLINRIDELSDEQVQTLRDHIDEQYPGRQVIGISARTGENLDRVSEALRASAASRNHLMEVDYDVYADGEAELGWLNATATLAAGKGLSLDDLAVGLVESIRRELLVADAEPAHLKILCSSARDVSVANLVSSDTDTMLSVSSQNAASEIKVVVNARVCIAPELLRPLVENVLEQMAEQHEAALQVEQMEAFRPGRPEPTHRVTSL
ncbi:CobW-like GTP-binding protein [Allorhodopirellula solitaria]|uniref:Putative GTP-binding protein YjiA n=1 Tax=Allorhodopirellula solitaria TaxID=2527987 RepID=A0A5C5YDV4_9BACT|nr:CobW-like GTP-binding protein [Allorhodopirellula solitaria]TWT73927.1 putative GTP-binding protein YjiA [Allorhodopirellula solitaria]